MTQDGKAYTPANYDLEEHGPVLLREALGSSLNIPAVIALDHIGMQGLFEQATALGISTLEDPGAVTVDFLVENGCRAGQVIDTGSARLVINLSRNMFAEFRDPDVGIFSGDAFQFESR